MEQTLMRMPTKLKNRLREIADKRGLSLNALTVQALWEFLEKIKE